MLFREIFLMQSPFYLCYMLYEATIIDFIIMVDTLMQQVFINWVYNR